LKISEYIRYADDFVIFARDQTMLRDTLNHIQIFLSDSLHLDLHPEKIFFQSVYDNVDWLGWQIFPHHRILRTKTKRRMLSRLSQKYRSDPENFDPVIHAYFALMSHGNVGKVEREVRERYGYLFKS
jgi:RNA-directed DNA polymerase